jgi:hypothetical protein
MDWCCACGWSGHAFDLERRPFGGIVCPRCGNWQGLDASDPDLELDAIDASPGPIADNAAVADEIGRVCFDIEDLAEHLVELAQDGRIHPHWLYWFAYRCLVTLDVTPGSLDRWRRQLVRAEREVAP